MIGRNWVLHRRDWGEKIEGVMYYILPKIKINYLKNTYFKNLGLKL